MRLRCLQQAHAGHLLFLSQLGHLAYLLCGMDLKKSDTGTTVLNFGNKGNSSKKFSSQNIFYCLILN